MLVAGAGADPSFAQSTPAGTIASYARTGIADDEFDEQSARLVLLKMLGPRSDPRADSRADPRPDPRSQPRPDRPSEAHPVAHFQPFAEPPSTVIEPEPLDAPPPAKIHSLPAEPQSSPTRSSQSPEILGDPSLIPGGWNLFATVSLVHLGGENAALQNPGFFPEVWFGGQWQSRGPITARVHACVSCHADGADPGDGSRLELAEGFLRLDILRAAGCCPREGAALYLDGGRFIVPFGAFAETSHPAAYRTATRPLMYNMGRNVYRDDVGPPILPMPYADEGLRLHLALPVWCDWDTTLDLYAVNGLQGNTSLDFNLSRDYADNNTDGTAGGRFTIGNSCLRVGTSVMAGRYDQDAGTAGNRLDYKVYGVDLTARCEDRLRLHVEYARRMTELYSATAGVDQEDLRGWLIEGEARIWDCPHVGLVLRYEEQLRDSPLAIPGSVVPTGDFGVRRFTWGVHFPLAGDSVLIINHEHWKVPAPLDNVDVLALRWVGVF